VVNKGVGAITGLGKAGNADGRERPYIVGYAGHPDALRDDVDVELRPGDRAEASIDRHTHAVGTVGDAPASACRELEPVSGIEDEGGTQIVLRLLATACR
jgi:hypothetical protein